MGKATAPGTLYSLGAYPGLAPHKGAGTLVKGEVYEIGADLVHEVLRALDDYEGVDVGDPQSCEYRRALIAVTLSDGRRVDAWAYVLNRSPEGLEPIPSGDFVEYLAARRPR